MKKILIFLICLIFSLIYSCFDKKKIQNKMSLIDIKSHVNDFRKIYLSELASNIKYVATESDLKHPLTWNTHFYADISDNYILDSDGRVCIIYDKEGHFLRQIGSQGRGPGEYMGVSSVFLIRNKIYIHDYFSDDLIEFNTDGAFLKKYNNGFTANEKYRVDFHGIVMINDSMILGHIENQSGNEEYKALIIDKQGQIKYYFKNYVVFKLEPGVDRVRSHGNVIIFNFRDKIYYKGPLNDTLFQINDQYQINPSYFFDFGSYKEPIAEFGKPWSKRDFSSYLILNNVFLTSGYLILVCDFGKYFPAKRLRPEIIRLPGHKDIIMHINTPVVVGVYDKTTKDLVFSEPTTTDNRLFSSGLYNDFDAGPRFVPDKMVNDSTMVMKVRFDYLAEHVRSDDFKNITPKYPDRKERLEGFVDSLMRVGFDNPVYMFVTYKTK